MSIDKDFEVAIGKLFPMVPLKKSTEWSRTYHSLSTEQYYSVWKAAKEQPMSSAYPTMYSIDGRISCSYAPDYLRKLSEIADDKCGHSSMVERQPSKLNTEGSIPPARSTSKAQQPDEKPRKCMICGYGRYCLNCMANGDQHKAMFPAIDDCRKEFEQWYASNGERQPPNWNGEEYDNKYCQYRWQGWKAAWEALCKN